MKNRVLVSSFALAVLATAVPASAQTFQPRKQRPDWSIFGSGVSNTGQKLILTANFGAGYDDNLSNAPAPPVVPIDPAIPVTPIYSGYFGSAGANLKYSVDKKSMYGDVQFGAQGRNYRQMTDPFIGTYSASGDWNFAFGKRASLATNAYAGQYLQNLAPGGYDSGSGWGAAGMAPVPGSPGVVTTGDTYRGFGAYASYNHRLAERLTFTAGYWYYANDSWSSVNNTGYASQWVNAALRYGLGKGFGIRAGYGVTLGGFNSTGTDYRSRNIDAGVDYNKSLSPTRKSTLSFGTGMSGIIDQAGTTHYYFVGNANFVYEIGRSWSAHAGVNRSADFYQTLGQPTVADWAVGGVSGLIGRRVTVFGDIGFNRGSEIVTGAKVYDSSNATGGCQIALNRVLAIAANYSYYRYQFTNDVQTLPPGFVRQTDQQSIRVSLNVWAPLVTQARRANASR